MQIQRMDIVGIIHRAFNASSNIENCKKAILHRGCNPMNYNLLDNEVLKNTIDNDAVQNSIHYCTLSGESKYNNWCICNTIPKHFGT
jgi:hypothetical protein